MPINWLLALLPNYKKTEDKEKFEQRESELKLRLKRLTQEVEVMQRTQVGED